VVCFSHVAAFPGDASFNSKCLTSLNRAAVDWADYRAVLPCTFIFYTRRFVGRSTMADEPSSVSGWYVFIFSK